MSGFYQLSSSSVVEMGISPNTSLQDIENTHYQPHPPPQIGSHSGPIINQYQGLPYYAGFADPIVFQEQKPQNNRNKKKSTAGIDHVKHRRTRSGCYTCRGRRVKCDEKHPICERCRKGKRDCVYPDPPAVKGAAGGSALKEAASASQEASPDSSLDDVDDSEREPKLESIPDEDEAVEPSPQYSQAKWSYRERTVSTLSLPKIGNRQNSESPSLEGTKSSSPSVSTGTSVSFSTTIQTPDATLQPNTINPEWAHLQKDLQYYLGYFCETITHFSYGAPNDPDNFFRSTLPSIAVQEGNDALLYALVGFSAYHCTLQHPHGRIEDFLKYYNKSVTLLLSSLKRGDSQDLPKLLAILQLATIEEYLGDWVNLSGHQTAALQILKQLFTPETIVQSSISAILTWYVRFDVFVAMMGAFETALPREWFVSAVEGSEERVKNDPDDLAWRIEVQATTLRLISMDMSLLYARSAKGDISADAFAEEYNHISTRMSEWRDGLDPAITDSSYLVTDFQHKQPLTDDDVVDPYKPGSLFKFPLFSTTILLMEWHSIFIMHRSRQEGYALQQEPSDELRRLSLSACEMFETIRLWPETPTGATITVQACLAIACLFIPRDQKYHMWIRRRYASLEASGYIFPMAMRSRMAELFRDPSCSQWWLPHDEGLFPILRNIRAFADARNGNRVTQQAEALREISAIFSNMRIDSDDSPSPREPVGAGKGKNVQRRS
ncbi:putative C6 finger domain-containing protein [Rosellinia necatrix]|uniref:Putative C6 finger domain-containing protein n=1 Tax=Rosellinia necatrix TaxID=77044 RepID=A0A1S7UHW8_ROSNE|nr:putative C6 finger domain-containing protein [Rosellinia necatrix]